MKEDVLDDIVARRFLLGQLSDEEQGQIEELAFIDPESFTFLQAVEADLIDEFLYGDLPPEEKAQFQKHFLSQPAHHHDLRVAKALQKYLNQDEILEAEVEPPVPEPAAWLNWLWPRSTPLRLSLAVIALVLLALLGTWLVAQLRRQQERTPIQADQEQPQHSATPATSASPSPAFATASPAPKTEEKRPSRPRPSTIYPIVLASGTATRSDGRPGRRFSLSPEYRKLEFNLSLTEKTSHTVFEAILESDSQTIQRWSDLHPRKLGFGRGITFQAPVELFQSQRSYRIRLSGVSSGGNLEHVNNYDFYIE